MKILVTGGLGHIGSAFLHNIKPSDFEQITIIDNMSSQRYCSLFNLPEDVNYRFIEKDILDSDIDEYIKEVDVVIHLAAITDATSSFENHEQVEKVNFVGTKKIAESCLNYSSRLIFPSTTSVYGVQQGGVDESCSEEDLKPQSPYAKSKLKSEKLLTTLGSEGLNFITCRFGTIFGTSIGMRFHTAVNKFCFQACTKRPLTVWKTAMKQKRPYLDISDAVSSILFIIRNNIFDRQIYNISTVNTTVEQIVNLIKSEIDDIEVNLVDSEIMNQLSYEVSSQKFSDLGFEFKGSFSRGIKETINLLINCNVN